MLKYSQEHWPKNQWNQDMNIVQEVGAWKVYVVTRVAAFPNHLAIAECLGETIYK